MLRAAELPQPGLESMGTAGTQPFPGFVPFQDCAALKQLLLLVAVISLSAWQEHPRNEVVGSGSVVLGAAQLWNKDQLLTGRGRCVGKARDKENIQKKDVGHFSSVIWEMSQGYMIYS